jgi:hypothetical protein
MAAFEALVEPEGSVIVGWMGPGVIHARLDGTLSTALAVRFASRFSAFIGDGVAVRYFYDASSVESYELSALNVVRDSLLSHRAQFEQIIARPWQDTVSEKARKFAVALECLRYVTSAAEFEDRLRAASAAVSVRMQHAGSALVDSSVPATAATEPSPYVYSFDLGQFERGAFTAVRCGHLSVRPEGAWVCVARDHEQALRLARHAAVSEWATPAARHPERFTVRFADFGNTAEPTIGGSEPDGTSERYEPLPARTPSNAPAAEVTHVYVFDLGDFEGGRFIATRVVHLAMRSGASWVCRAGNDAQALALAREASIAEWPEPHTRLPEQFTVRFLEPLGARALDGRR